MSATEIEAPEPKLRLIRVPRRLRNLELALLLLALLINVAAVLLVQSGVGIEIDLSLLQFAIVPGVLALVLHLALRFRAPDADPLILPIATVLNGLGVAMIYRIDLGRGDQGWESFGVRQLVWTAIAMTLALLVVLLLNNHRVLQRFSYVFMTAGILLLLMPFLPGIGRTINGAALWISVAGFTFQPGEVAKICLAIFFAGYLVSHRDSLAMVGPRVLGVRLPRARDLGPILVIWAASLGVLIFQHDLGTSLLYFGLFVVMLYAATGRVSWILLGLVLFALGAVLAVQSISYVNDRVAGWLHAFAQENYEAVGGSYQLVQGIFGMASGGLSGTGLGQGRPGIVPLAESDFIIPSLGEELGLIGLFAILALYILLVSRGFKIGFAGQDDFGRLLAVGLAFVIGLQCFIVIGGVTRVIPLTGLTTPFLAAGGSSLVANWIIVAILLRLSDSVRHQPGMVIGG